MRHPCTGPFFRCLTLGIAVAGGLVPAAELAGQCAWDAIGAPGLNNSVYAAAEWDPDGPGPLAKRLVVGGNFTSAGGNSSIKQLAAFDGTSWTGFGTGFFAPGGTAAVYALAARSNGDLIVGGQFQSVNGMPAKYIARYSGTTGTWSSMGAGGGAGGGTDFLPVRALAALDSGEVIVGGEFTSIGGVQCGRVARWSPVGGLGGMFTPLNNGSGPGGVLGGNVYAVLPLANGDVIVGGSFSSAFTSTARGVAKWNAANGAWTGFGQPATPGGPVGIFGEVRSLLITPSGDFYAGGGFAIANGGPADYIARFDNTNWVSVFGGMNQAVLAMTVASDGAIVVGGGFTIAGGGANGMGATGVPANKIARLQGGAWSAMSNGGAGVGGMHVIPAAGSAAVFALLRLTDGDLAAGGFFTSVGNQADLGGASANYIARWACGEPPCPADFNGSDGVSVADIFAFLTAWFAGDPSANFDGTGGLTVSDIFEFLSAWFAGCP